MSLALVLTPLALLTSLVALAYNYGAADVCTEGHMWTKEEGGCKNYRLLRKYFMDGPLLEQPVVTIINWT